MVVRIIQRSTAKILITTQNLIKMRTPCNTYLKHILNIFVWMTFSVIVVFSQQIEAEGESWRRPVIKGINTDLSDIFNVGVLGRGYDGVVGFGRGTKGVGVYGRCTDSRILFSKLGCIGVVGTGEDSYGVYGSSYGYHGAFFEGGCTTCVDIVLGGWYGNDKGVISTDSDEPSSDMHLVSYDDVIIELDENSDETGLFQILNSADNALITVNESGNMGIGVTSPEARMHVSVPGIADQQTIVQILSSHTSNRPILLFSESASGINLSDGMSIEYDGRLLGSNNKLYINDLGGDHLVTFKNDGMVGIGKTNPNDALDVVGDIDATGCIQVDNSGSIGGDCVSDARQKNNIQPLENQLGHILSLMPSRYEKIDSDKTRDNEIGLIAQQVEEVIPEMVSTDQNGLKRIRYDITLQVRMIKAIQEQQMIIEKQQSEIQDLKEDLLEIRSLIDQK